MPGPSVTAERSRACMPCAERGDRRESRTGPGACRGLLVGVPTPGGGLGMPGNYARAIPQFEALANVLTLRQQRIGFRSRRFVSESGKFLEGRDMASPHEIAQHDCNSHLNEGVRDFLEMEGA